MSGPYVSIRVFSVLFFILFSGALHCSAAPCKVLAVMSYHDGMPWENDIREGIERELKGACDVRYVYMNTKNNPAGGAEMAKEAFRLYQEFQPDGVIAADDDAQLLFVVPYLKDRVKTPVIFCGVNADPREYGFPSSNVTGILERAHFRESIAFLQQMLPNVKSVGFMVTDNQTGWGYVKQIDQEAAGYPIRSFTVSKVKTLNDAVRAAGKLRKRHDALFLVALEGLTDENGNPLAERESFQTLTAVFGKPAIGINRFNVRSNILCAVAKTGQEQGKAAAGMLLGAISGTPVQSIPVTRNMEGRRVLNVSVMKKFGIKPRPVLLVGTELVKAEE